MQKLIHSAIAAGLVFAVSACNLFLPVDPLPPVVSEVSVIQVVTSGATVSGTVRDPDGKNSRQDKKSGQITEYGFVYATRDKPTIEDGTALKIGNVVTTTPFQFQGQITGLNVVTTYFVRTYAKNEGGGVSYGVVASFKTDKYTVPLIQLGAITDVTKSSATVGVSFFDRLGTETISSFGVCYSSTNKTPTISDSKTEIGSNTSGANYTATMTGLTAGVTYYARAYAIYAGGITYSQTLTFTPGEPTVFTSKKSFTMYYSNPYDLDLGELVSQVGAEDLTWYPYNDKAGIYPKNGAKFAVLGQLTFDNVKYSDVTKAILTTDFINGSYTDANANKLPNGTVVAYITNQGRYGKMSIDAHGQDRVNASSSGGDMQVTILTYNK
ncbi:hypothetical protein [Dyadobacter frigoris]|uniref:Fibronectin type-III domain-containing protein n=1 Tax=Dyadobacter frigoris TaxID=2576211 RepID=A0A4U6CZU6_9BACT|nr:hypothetical protein [Dyadobacter frigoris]TKT88928.1 hypothetical protein FDK13_25185 [Dyadobacter frigoris]GLU56973.1 hypothetical protein Dfri01_64340 [Dyadobacter frigoris]